MYGNVCFLVLICKNLKIKKWKIFLLILELILIFKVFKNKYVNVYGWKRYVMNVKFYRNMFYLDIWIMVVV